MVNSRKSSEDSSGENDKPRARESSNFGEIPEHKQTTTKTRVWKGSPPSRHVIKENRKFKKMK